MARVHRVGDANDAGGVVTVTPQGFVRIKGALVSVDGAIGTGHPPCPVPPIHCGGAWQTANGASWVRINGIPVNRVGDADTCGHVRDATPSHVSING